MAALDGGVAAVQLREKDLSDAEISPLAGRIREITDGQALFFINGRVNVAASVGADGVHLPEDSTNVAAVRRNGPVEMLVGKSVHSVEAGLAAESEGADLLIAGTIFPSSSHPDRKPQGVTLLEELDQRVRVPYLAIGGITEENVGALIAAGASGAAVITAITESKDPARATRRLADAITEAWMSRHNVVKAPAV